jgi:8-oxo-dGTP pyrophosphatase MutT (NUDIX family)
MESSILNAVGVWFYSRNTNRFLYLLRNDPRHPYHWGLAGGKVEKNETLLATIDRECCEELGSMPYCTHLVPIEKFTNGNFCFHTFFACVPDEFHPVLNHEHIGYAWIESGVWPKPMHPGLWNTVNFDVVQHKLEIIMSRLDIIGVQPPLQ